MQHAPEHEDTYRVEALSHDFIAAQKECERAALRGNMAGISTGFRAIDSVTGGMCPGQLWTLGGGTGSGKSALALGIARNVATNQFERQQSAHDVYFASLEMVRTSLIHRMAAISSGINLLSIMNWSLPVEDRRRHMDAMGREEKIALYIYADDRARITIKDIRVQLDWINFQGTLAFAVVDYLQLVTPSKPQHMREREVAEAARGLKELAMEYKIPVLGCSQFSRDADNHDEPSLRHLRESGEIEQASDVVILICGEEEGIKTLRVAKCRNGKCGKFQLAWNPNCVRFSDLSTREVAVPEKAPYWELRDL